jgi:hypothetical protein
MNPILAATAIFSGGGDGGGDAVHQLLYLVVIGIVLGIIYYLVQIAPFLPALFKTILGWLIILFGAIILINVLLGLVGHPLFVF